MAEIVAISTSRERLNMLLMSIFGGAALVLAALGIYGLLAYSVQQRTQELGIRAALGAEPQQIRHIVRARVRCSLVGESRLGSLRRSSCRAGWLRFCSESGRATSSRSSVCRWCSWRRFAAVVVARRAGRVDPLDALRHE